MIEESEKPGRNKQVGTKPRASRPKKSRQPDQQTPKAAQSRKAPAGLAARQVAVKLVDAVLRDGRALEEVLADIFGLDADQALPARDRAFARAVASAVLRRHGELNAVLSQFLDKPLPARQGSLSSILLCAAAQLLILKTPPHAAISLAVDQCRADRRASRFGKLANAILRRVDREGAAILEKLDTAELSLPPWLWQRWCKAYNEPLARRIVTASLREAALDISVKSDAGLWAEKLGGTLLNTRTVRLSAGGRIAELNGFAEGNWWVQDAAAALPATLLGAKPEMRIVDLCAAPGGKTAQLAAAGALVTAVDLSQRRLSRVEDNLKRLGLTAELIAADATTWKPDKPFDAVLLDAPCSATGTIRRHPDIPHLKRDTDFATLAQLQAGLLKNVTNLIKPGGTLVYCTCSLEPEEGPEQIERFLADNPNFAREPIEQGESGISADWLTGDGDLRTLPCHRVTKAAEQPVQKDGDAQGAVDTQVTPEDDLLAGLDGFYAARLRYRP